MAPGNIHCGLEVLDLPTWWRAHGKRDLKNKMFVEAIKETQTLTISILRSTYNAMKSTNRAFYVQIIRHDEFLHLTNNSDM